jgi:alpha-tubulin suppressor-like RCC1 family protein
VAFSLIEKSPIRVVMKMTPHAVMLILVLAFVRQVTAQSVPNVTAWDGYGTVQTNVPQDLTNAVAVAAGYTHVLALRANGTVVAWGDNSRGQTNVPSGLTNVVAIASGGYHSLALTFDGKLVAWGTNFHGEATVPPGLDGIGAIACGFYHNLALRSDGTVVAWGTNFFGESSVPPGLDNVVAIAAGDNFNTALRADGTVVSWGMYLDTEYWYPMVAPHGLSNVVAIAAGAGHCLALKMDGTLVVWGDSQGVVPAGLSNVVAVAAAGDHNLALRTDGTVVAFGFSAAVPTGLSNVVAIGDGAYSLALIDSGPPVSGPRLVDRAVAQDAGTVVFYASAVGGWPLTYQWQCNGTNLVDATNEWLILTTPPPVDAGIYSVIVSNAWGQASTQAGLLKVVPALFSRVDQVAYLGGTATFTMGVEASPPLSYQWRFEGRVLAGETNSTLVLRDVTRALQGAYSVLVSNQFGSVLSPPAQLWVVNVAGWGANGSYFPYYGGQSIPPASLSNAVAIDAGDAHSLALRADGTVVAWGANESGETNVPTGLSNVVAIAAGSYHNLALQQDGKVVAWGSDRNGEAEVPPALCNVVAVTAGGYHNLALCADGTVVAWGADDYGQTSVPTGLSNVVAIAAGLEHSLALCRDGTLAAWGQYHDLRTRQWLPMTANACCAETAIGSGMSHCLVVVSTGGPGTVFAWGDDTSGQTDAPQWLSDAVAVNGGNFHSLALRADGTVVAWGDNSVGQTNVPGDLQNVIAIAAGGEHNLALIGASPPVLHGLLSKPSLSNSTFTVSVASQSGRVYALEFKESLDENAWRPLQLAAGNGASLTLTDATAATSRTRYYRVLQW